MSKSEDTMKIIKTGTTRTLSGKSTLTFQVGCSSDNNLHIRITKNTGGGFFSNEWLSVDAVLDALKNRPRESPVMSHFLTPLLKGKSVNTSAFLLAALTDLKLLRPLPKKKRVHELLDPQPFLDTVEKLMAGTPTKRPVRKAQTKKAAIKKKAMSRRKKATTSTKKVPSARS